MMTNRVMAALLAPWAFACGGYDSTTRLVDGQVITSYPIAPQAYALYLEATLQEASGNLTAARDTFVAATEFESKSPELWTRVADLSCRLRLPSADDEFVTALERDPWYAPAWIARSRCELGRGNSERALEFAKQAQISAANDFDTTDVLTTTLLRLGDTDGALRQWVGYTVLRPSDHRGWKRLAEVSDRAGDVVWAQWANAAYRSLRADPVTSQTATRAATEDHFAFEPMNQALLRHDLATARAFATDQRIEQVVVLERALTLGRPQLALEQAKVLVTAYPESADVRALSLLAAARARDEASFSLWSRLPERLTPLSARGVDALQQLLREQAETSVP